MALTPFKHEDLDVGLYLRDLAAYAIGRLLTRFEWHLKQAILLAAGTATPIGDSSFWDLLALRHPGRAKSSWLPIFKQLNDQMAERSSSHFTAARRIAVASAGIALQIPIANALAVAKETEAKILRVLAESTHDDLAIEVQEANEQYRAAVLSSDGPEDEAADKELRCELCRKIVERIVSAPLLRLADNLQSKMNDDQRHLFLLARDLECGLCPRFVHTALDGQPRRSFLVDRRPQHDKQIAAIGALLIAYEGRMPGELYPEPQWPRIVRHDILRLGQLPVPIDQLLRGVEEKITDRDLNASALMDATARIHEWVVDQFEADRPTKEGEELEKEPEIAAGVFGEILEIDPSGSPGILRLAELETKIDRPSEITLARLLILAKGNEIKFAVIRQALPKQNGPSRGTRGEPNNDLHAIRSRLQSKLDKVGLIAESVRGIGYRLIRRETSG
jgi:hypothetical protein